MVELVYISTYKVPGEAGIKQMYLTDNKASQITQS